MEHIGSYRLFEKNSDFFNKLPEGFIKGKNQEFKDLLLGLDHSKQKEVLDKVTKIDKLIRDSDSKLKWSDFDQSDFTLNWGLDALIWRLDKALYWASFQDHYNRSEKKFPSRYIVTGIYGKDDSDRFLRDNIQYNFGFLYADFLGTTFSELKKEEMLITIVDAEAKGNPRIIIIFMNDKGDILYFNDNTYENFFKSMKNTPESRDILDNPFVELVLLMTKLLFKNPQCSEIVTYLIRNMYN